jgi:hypothetical protein
MEQIDILRHAVESLERMNVPYLVVGSFASIAYGESRFHLLSVGGRGNFPAFSGDPGRPYFSP